MQYLRLFSSTFLVGALLAGVLTVAVAGLAGAFRHYPRRMALARALLVFLLGSGAAFTAIITLLPPQGAAAQRRYVSWDLVGDLAHQLAGFPSSTAGAQMAINLLLLTWLALLLPLLSPRFGLWRTTVICFGATVTIEALQYALDTGRAATLADVVLNALGAFIAAVICIKHIRPRVRTLLDPGTGREAGEPVAGQPRR